MERRSGNLWLLKGGLWRYRQKGEREKGGRHILLCRGIIANKDAFKKTVKTNRHKITEKANWRQLEK